jgi:hypothetical protein
MTVGDVDVARMGFDPSVRVSAFDYGEAATMADGSVGCEREITAFDQERAGEPALNWITFSGAAAGVALMYLTALLVAA